KLTSRIGQARNPTKRSEQKRETTNRARRKARPNQTHQNARPNPTAMEARRPAHPGQPPARPKQAGGNRARLNRTGHRVDRRNEVPNWGKARTLHMGTTATDWHFRDAQGTFIAGNYPLWSGDWWSAKWGRWFRIDLETSAYYYYEPAIGA